jgi:hypothetical protein
MGMEPVVPHSDAETDRHPVESGGNGQSLPAEHKKRRDGAHMKKDQRNARDPVNLIPLTRRRIH